MSMIDRTFEPLPKRASPDDRAQRHGETWFSTETIYRAQHYADLSWFRLAWPVVIALVLVLFGRFVLGSPGSALVYIPAALIALVAAHGLLSKALLRQHPPEK